MVQKMESTGDETRCLQEKTKPRKQDIWLRLGVSMNNCEKAWHQILANLVRDTEKGFYKTRARQGIVAFY